MVSALSAVSNATWCGMIPLLPFLSFAVLGLFTARRFPDFTALCATASVMVSCAGSWILAKMFMAGAGTVGPSPVTAIPISFEWIRYQEGLVVRAGVLVDSLSVMMMVVVTSISALVHVYSLSYMKDEDGKGRFFVFLNLFTASMLGLVCAPNLLQLFACWELVGASSFLLIGFYYTRPAAVAASKKAFVVTRFADLGFLLGIIALGSLGASLAQSAPALISAVKEQSLQVFDFSYLLSPLFVQEFSQQTVWGWNALSVILLLIFIGAAGKSAMFPLHIWLPDAMEGPTPVSALIHAATMVVAGVFLVARLFPLYCAAPSVLEVIAVVGAFTALFAALIGCAQDDLKRILAFSTLSQLGYMMLSLGVASDVNPAGYSASMFHLFTHAFFKAQLFLCAGVIIHQSHTNSVWEIGGLARRLPLFHLLFVCALLAICGVYPFAGFFSKDAILLAAFESDHLVVFATALGVAGLTAFYMSRLYFLCFWGKTSDRHVHHGISLFELVPIALLAGFSVIAGLVPISDWVFFGEIPAHAEHERLIPILGSVMAAIGISSAWLLYVGKPALREALVGKLGIFYQLTRKKFYIDEAYLFLVHRLIIPFISKPCAWFDRHVVDGGVNLSGDVVRQTGRGVSRLQNGQLQLYGIWLLNGVILLLVFFLVT